MVSGASCIISAVLAAFCFSSVLIYSLGGDGIIISVLHFHSREVEMFSKEDEKLLEKQESGKQRLTTQALYNSFVILGNHVLTMKPNSSGAFGPGNNGTVGSLGNSINAIGSRKNVSESPTLVKNSSNFSVPTATSSSEASSSIAATTTVSPKLGIYKSVYTLPILSRNPSSRLPCMHFNHESVKQIAVVGRYLIRTICLTHFLS